MKEKIVLSNVENIDEYVHVWSRAGVFIIVRINFLLIEYGIVNFLKLSVFNTSIFIVWLDLEGSW